MIQHRHPAPKWPARVVVLGANGFVARDLLRHLRGEGVTTEAVGAARLDLRDPASAAGLQAVLRPNDALVFVSALTPDRGRDVRTFMTNLAMGEHVCAALEKALCAHVVYVSSDAVYADDVNPVRETSCCHPTTFHGLMHLAREQMLAHTLQKPGTPLLRLRASLLFGAGDTHNGYGPNRFMRSALKEKRIALFGEGEEKRDHVYIKNLSRLIGLALARGSAGVLNVATGQSVSFREVAEAVAGLVPGPVRIEGTPRQNPITHRHFDTTAALRAFPEFHYTPLAAALAETYREAAPPGGGGP